MQRPGRANHPDPNYSDNEGTPMLRSIFGNGTADLRARITGLAAILVVANVAAWAWALIAFRDYPALLATAFVAYGFGLRHAVDADHIAAIDNVTRKLMQEGKRPVGVGMFFSLGHSTIVVLASVGIAATATALKDRFDTFRDIGGIVGTLVSGLFLLAIAAMNLVILVGLWRQFRAVRAGTQAVADVDVSFGGGPLARLFRPMFRMIGRSWQMYPLGFLFGLGFDTATEIGLLGIAAAGASKGLSIWSILVFPALFTAGMSLVDSLDSVLMLGAYGWAFVKPLRKLYYNLTITLLSALVAIVVGGIEVLGLIGDQFALDGKFWDGIGWLNDNFGSIGFVIVGLFAAGWAASAVIYRVKRYDRLDSEASAV
jgi:high-affinity nickel-transport protein